MRFLVNAAESPYFPFQLLSRSIMAAAFDEADGPIFVALSAQDMHTAENIFTGTISVPEVSHSHQTTISPDGNPVDFPGQTRRCKTRNDQMHGHTCEDAPHRRAQVYLATCSHRPCGRQQPHAHGDTPVSYTHLTLPTKA